MENTPAQQEALNKHINWYNNLNEIEKREYDLYIANCQLEDLHKEHMKVIRCLINKLDKSTSVECINILQELQESDLYKHYVKPYL